MNFSKMQEIVRYSRRKRVETRLRVTRTGCPYIQMAGHGGNFSFVPANKESFWVYYTSMHGGCMSNLKLGKCQESSVYEAIDAQAFSRDLDKVRQEVFGA